jgi:flagellar hook-associated protein FlgK
LSDLFIKANDVVNSPTEKGIKDGFVNQAGILSNTVSSIARSILDAKTEAQMNLGNNIDNLNTIIKELFSINRQISSLKATNMDCSDMLDERDRCLSEISNYFALGNVDTDENGCALVRVDGCELVSNNGYGQLLFRPVNVSDGYNTNAKIGNIAIHNYNELDQLSGTHTMFNGANIDSLPAGSIRGYINLHDNVLKQSMDNVDLISQSIMDHVNRIHNRGAGTACKSEIIGTKSCSLNTRMNWKGDARIYVVDSNGNSVSYSDGTSLEPLTLNLAKLSNNKVNAHTTLSDVCEEINNYFYAKPDQRVSMGSIDGTQYRLSDVKMVSDCYAGNIFNFDFEISNSSNIDHKFEILDVSLIGYSDRVISMPKNIAELEGGSTIRTYDNCRINLTNIDPDNATVRVKMRIIGDDGHIEEGYVDYPLQTSQLQASNTRIVGSPSATSGNSVVQRAASYERFLSADIVDAHGNSVDNGYGSGYLRLRTVSEDYRVIIEDNSSCEIGVSNESATFKGFGHYFGMNNFFVEDDGGNYALHMKVRDDIAYDSTYMSMGYMQPNPIVEVNESVGVIAASGTLYFNDTPPTDIPTDYDGMTITVADQTITLVNGPISAINQINISAITNVDDLNASIVNNLSSLRSLKSILTFSCNTIDHSIVLTANNPGVSGNDITTRVQSAAALCKTDSTAAFAADTGVVNLSGGANDNALIAKNRLGYSISVASSEIIRDIASLGSNAVQMKGNSQISPSVSTLIDVTVTATSSLVGAAKELNSQRALSEKTLEIMQEQYKVQYKVDESIMMMQVFACISMLSNILFAISKWNEMDQVIVNFMQRQ